MMILAIQSSPDKEGLTATMARVALETAESLGADTGLVHLNDLGIGSCKACGPGGWGTCLNEGTCRMGDGFEDMRRRMDSADAIVFVTPVYWGDLSESAKNLMDRLRRCEFRNTEGSLLKGKPFIGIACAGGSGRGTEGAVSAFRAYIPWIHVLEAGMVPLNRENRVEREALIRKLVAGVIRGVGE